MFNNQESDINWSLAMIALTPLIMFAMVVVQLLNGRIV